MLLRAKERVGNDNGSADAPACEAKQKAEKEKERLMYVEHVREATPASRLIVKYWLLRTRMLRKLRTQLMHYIKQ